VAETTKGEVGHEAARNTEGAGTPQIVITDFNMDSFGRTY
jgi:hypothetical protein